MCVPLSSNSSAARLEKRYFSLYVSISIQYCYIFHAFTMELIQQVLYSADGIDPFEDSIGLDSFSFMHFMFFSGARGTSSSFSATGRFTPLILLKITF